MKQVRKAIFPAAGIGADFLPATKVQPKVMLPIVDKPMIQYAVEEAFASGISNAIVIGGRHIAAIMRHFDISVELEHILKTKAKRDLLEAVHELSQYDLSYITQFDEPWGLGNGLLRAERITGEEPFGVVLPDEIILSETPCLRQLMDVYAALPEPACVLAVARLPRTSLSQYGVIQGDVLQRGPFPGLISVSHAVEKPAAEEAPTDMGIVGRYILTPDIFAALRRAAATNTGPLHLTDGINALLSLNYPVYAFNFNGVRFDAGTKMGFLQATIRLALRRPDLRDQFRIYLTDLCRELSDSTDQ